MSLLKSCIYTVPTILLLIFFQGCADNSTSNNEVIDPPSVPVVTNDGWEVSTPEEQGLDAETIAELNNDISNGEFGEIHSMHIARNGYLILDEYYWPDHSEEKLHNLASVSKSVLSVLIGIAIKEGYIQSIDQSIADFFPEYSQIFENDTNKKEIKLHNLLSMTAGLEWIDGHANQNGSDCSNMDNSEDAVEYILSRQVAAESGTQFHYCGGCSILLSAIIQSTTGLKADEFAEQYLFTPLGISNYECRHITDGHADFDGGLRLRPRDLAKIGQLYLNNGIWNGVEIVTAEWIETSTGVWSNPFGIEHYGFQWWLIPLSNIDGHEPQPNDIYFGSGFGGQKLFVIPNLNLVVVFTGNCTGYDVEDNQSIYALLLFIIPSIMN